MTLTTQQLWQEAYRRSLLLDTEKPISEYTVDEFLKSLPKRLGKESYLDWIKRGQKLGKVIAFPKLNFRYLTDVPRLAANTATTKDALPEKPLLSSNNEFRLTVKVIAKNKVKLLVEALGLASGQYAHRLIGIAATQSKEDLITLIHLDEYGEGVDNSLENTAAVREALLRPVIALVE